MSNPEQPQYVQRTERPQPPDDADVSAPQSAGPQPSRRQVIAGAGVGLGLVASGALAGVAGSAVLGSGATPAATGDGPTGDVVAHVRDASTGDIDVFFGDQQVRIRDRAVAARLAAVTR